MSGRGTDATAPGARARAWAAAPFPLVPNQPAGRPYRGGAGIARFRRIPGASDDPFTPEDFLASTTTIHGSDTIGLSMLEPGVTLRDAVRAEPQAFLGQAHVERYGAETMLLVKLLNTAERLFVHFHPDDAFADARFGEPRGKTEAWIVVAVDDGVDGFAAIGFDRDVPAEEVAEWFAAQDAERMLGAMHRVPLRPGNTLLVPAGIPHAIGPGVTLVELQQPQDLSILLEYDGYGDLGEQEALLGLSASEAIGGLDRRRWTSDGLRHLGTGRGSRGGIATLFPVEADPYFRAERIAVRDPMRLAPAFSVLVATAGSGLLRWAGGALPVRAGDVVCVPFAVGDIELSGDCELVRARPPA